MTLVWFALAWLAGIAAGQTSVLATWQWLVLSAISLAAAVLFRVHRFYRLLFVCLLTLCLGAARSHAALPPSGPGFIAAYNDGGSRVTLEGIITDPPETHDTYAALRVQAGSLLLGEDQMPLPVRGLVLVQAPRQGDWAYGDRVRATGRLETPPDFESFSYREYLARQGIRSLMPYALVTRLAVRQANPVLQALYDFRTRTLSTIYTLFPDPEASLLAGILLGDESGIPPEVRQAFNVTGTSHVIAISGFNISIVAGLFVSVLGRWLGRRRGTAAAALAIAVYTVLVGAQASVVRAAIMAGLALLARRLGRLTDGLAALAATAWVMTAANPSVLWDAGFQLSFAATLGLILYSAPLKDWLVRMLSRRWNPDLAARLGGPISEYGLFTLAAQVTTLPLTVYYFRRLSLASLIANPVILPAQPGVMILGGLAALLGTAWIPLGRAAAWVAWPFAAFTIRSVEFFAHWQHAAIPLGPMTAATVAGLYLLLFGITAWAKMPPERRPRLPIHRLGSPWNRLPVWAGLAALAFSASVPWRLAADRPDGRMHVTVLDVGSGDAVLVESPTGRFVLIDGGPSSIALSEALGRRLPPMARHLDWLVLAATGEDQVAGLADVIERFPVDRALIAGPPGGSGYRHLMERLAQAGCPILPAEAGQVLDLGGGARLEVSAVGEQGAILLLTYARFRLLLGPGADPDLVAGLSREASFDRVTVALLPDGGYSAVNPPEWLARLRPWVALVSVEAGNRRGLPSPETLETLSGTTLLRTDLNGWIELTSDGQSLWVEVERGQVAP